MDRGEVDTGNARRLALVAAACSETARDLAPEVGAGSTPWCAHGSSRRATWPSWRR
ncbi:hypothetical protein AB0I60_10960 [Actinosynnema sp. NPDC050436]|uniref:hypothetical protein n=1 Tax=Actinosynnema sp. NPDC050436 TaxID=3155659 RepID=UPI0033CA7770